MNGRGHLDLTLGDWLLVRPKLSWPVVGRLSVLVAGVILLIIWDSVKSTRTSFDLLLFLTRPLYSYFVTHLSKLGWLTALVLVLFYGLVLASLVNWATEGMGGAATNQQGAPVNTNPSLLGHSPSSVLANASTSTTKFDIPQGLIAWVMELTYSSIYITPSDPDRINYWADRRYPLDSIINDNVVCWHLMISLLCCVYLRRKYIDRAVWIGMFLYNLLLVLFLLSTRNTNTSALFLAVLFAWWSDWFTQKINEQLEAYWTKRRQRQLQNIKLPTVVSRQPLVPGHDVIMNQHSSVELQSLMHEPDSSSEFKDDRVLTQFERNEDEEEDERQERLSRARLDQQIDALHVIEQEYNKEESDQNVNIDAEEEKGDEEDGEEEETPHE